MIILMTINDFKQDVIISSQQFQLNHYMSIKPIYPIYTMFDLFECIGRHRNGVQAWNKLYVNLLYEIVRIIDGDVFWYVTVLHRCP